MQIIKTRQSRQNVLHAAANFWQEATRSLVAAGESLQSLANYAAGCREIDILRFSQTLAP